MFKLKAAHEKALRATLRVTLIGALAGCGGGGSSGSGAATKPTPSPSVVAAAAGDPTTEADCRAALTAAYPDGDAKWFDATNHTARAQTPVSDAALTACCEKHSDALSDQDYRAIGCCSSSWNGGHCTPWGPPMPAAMLA